MAALEKRIASEYQKAAQELQEKIDAYFEQFKKRDAQQLQRLQEGKITAEYYRQWRLAQMGRGKRFQALRDKIAQRMTQANETAAAYINDRTPGIYSLNRNYAAYTIERQAGEDVGFDLWDEQTVKRLIVEQPDLMPYYPPQRAVKRGIDLEWGKRQISAQITTGILQGEGIPRLADRLQKNIPEMNRTSAIRAARTAVTGAQNAGRLDSYLAAEEMGIPLKKQWMATLDGRTRHAHAALDGQTQDIRKPFQSELGEIMYPGDPAAAPANVYNCRCTLVSQVEGVDTSSAQRRARDPVTGKSEIVENITYEEWYAAKEKQHGARAVEAARKKGEREAADRKQFADYKAVLGKNAPKSFEKFREVKYNDTEKWERLKAFRRYKGRVPEAAETDFQKYLEVKATGVIGSVRVPPEKIDAEKLAFRDAHGARHGCTVEDARGYVKSAYCSIAKKRWDGISINYYSANGATYVDKETMKIKTSFSREDYDPNTKAIVGVFE